MKKQLKGSLLLLFATIIWGSTFIAQSVGMDYIGPFTFQTIRCLLAVVAMLPCIYVFDRFTPEKGSFLKRWSNPKLWKTGTLCGIALFVAANLQQVGLVDTDAGKAGFITAMYIVLVPILAFSFKTAPIFLHGSALLLPYLVFICLVITVLVVLLPEICC